MAALPHDVTPLFWDVEPVQVVDLGKHRDYVMERVMTRGSWDAMQWLRATYSKEVLADFLRRKGERVLAPRERAYWSMVSGCRLSSEPGGGRPSWAGHISAQVLLEQRRALRRLAGFAPWWSPQSYRTRGSHRPGFTSHEERKKAERAEIRGMTLEERLRLGANLHAFWVRNYHRMLADWIELCELLVAHGAEFLLVGGQAVEREV